MLPALPSPPPWRVRALAVLLSLLLLPALLSACGGVGQPPRAVLLDALALQIQLTQGEIAEALDLPPVGTPEVSRVRVEQQQPLRVGETRGLRLTGRFDWRLAGDPIRVDSPFEIVLQRGERGESWRLARAVGAASGSAAGQDDQQAWITDPLPLPGQARS